MKLDQLTDDIKRNIFLQKSRIKYGRKTSSRPRFLEKFNNEGKANGVPSFNIFQ